LSAQLELAGRSLKGQLRHADRIGARYVAIVGDDGRASLRDMGSGEQRDIDTDAVVSAIKDAAS
jgi:histidyl-tRNA synthetase